MSEIHTHYKRLNLSINASDDEINEAYSLLLAKYNPENFIGDDKEKAIRAFNNLKNSYEVLINPIKRTEHDIWIKQQEKDSLNLNKEIFISSIKKQTEDKFAQIKNISEKIDSDNVIKKIHDAKKIINSNVEEAKEKIKPNIQKIGEDIKETMQNIDSNSELKTKNKVINENFFSSKLVKILSIGLVISGTIWFYTDFNETQIDDSKNIINKSYSNRKQIDNANTNKITSAKISVNQSEYNDLRNFLIERALSFKTKMQKALHDDDSCDYSNAKIIYEKKGIVHDPVENSNNKFNIPAMAIEFEATCINKKRALKNQNYFLVFGAKDSEFNMYRCLNSGIYSYSSYDDFRQEISTSNGLRGYLCEFDGEKELSNRYNWK